MNTFLKLEQLELNPAGYLVTAKDEKPVTHPEFVKQQELAHFTVKLAEAVKGKNFKTNKVDSLDAIMTEVRNSISASTKVSYISSPTKPTSSVNEEMVNFALNFAKYEDEKVNAEKLNEVMQQFNKINDVDQIGDFFQDGLVKLAKVYTIAEIQAAVVSYAESTK